MQTSEAQSIIDLIGGATNATRFNAATYEYWINALDPLDVRLATAAALAGVQDWEFFPSWSLFYERYQMQRREHAADVAHAENVAARIRPGRTPEWAFVWLWARYMRDPRYERSFPQQEDWVDPTDVMTMKEYEDLRGEWLRAGQPRLRLSSVLVGR